MLASDHVVCSSTAIGLHVTITSDSAMIVVGDFGGIYFRKYNFIKQHERLSLKIQNSQLLSTQVSKVGVLLSKGGKVLKEEWLIVKQ